MTLSTGLSCFITATTVVVVVVLVDSSSYSSSHQPSILSLLFGDLASKSVDGVVLRIDHDLIG